MHYDIIDAHAHIFPPKIAERAVESISGFYDIPMCHEGTSEKLIQSGQKIGVSKYLVCSTATRPDQVKAINDFIYAECNAHTEFIGFATLHPDQTDLEETVEQILKRGYYGIKLHPDFQEFEIDSQKAQEIYRLAEGKLPILFHTGDDRYDYSGPRRLARVAEKFPKLRCIAAHFGGYREWDEAFDVYGNCPEIYMDTSSSLFSMPKEQALSFIEKFGEKRFFFGSDFPMWDHKEELDRVMSLGLDDKTLKTILSVSFTEAIIHYNGRK